MKDFLNHGPLTSLTAGKKKTIKLTRGVVYHKTILECLKNDGSYLTPSEMIAAIGLIRLKADKETIVELTAAELLMLQNYHKEYYGCGQQNGFIVIDHERGIHDISIAGLALAIGTADVKNMTLEVFISDTTHLDSIEVNGEVTHDALVRMGTHLRLTRDARNMNNAGDETISDIDHTNQNVGVAAIHFATDIEKTTVRANMFTRIQDMSKGQANLFNRDGKRSPQTGYYHLDFSLSNQPGDFLAMGLTDFRLFVNHKTAPTDGAYVMITEEIYGINAA